MIIVARATTPSLLGPGRPNREAVLEEPRGNLCESW